MKNWKEQLRFDPIPTILLPENKAILYFVKKNLLEEKVESIDILWELPEVEKILKIQQDNGSWKYAGGKKRYTNTREIQPARNLQTDRFFNREIWV